MPAQSFAVKEQLIENFIAGINDVDDVMTEWNGYVAEQREADLKPLLRMKTETGKKLASFWKTLSGRVK